MRVLKMHSVKISVPGLVFEYYENRIVTTKRTPNGDDGIDPSDDFMFIGPRMESWESGPIWLDETGAEDTGPNRWIKDSDTGWVHYFNNSWTTKEKQATFVEYVLICVYNDTVSFPSSDLCLQENSIVFGKKILHVFDPTWSEEDKVEKYQEYVKRCLKAYFNKFF